MASSREAASEQSAQLLQPLIPFAVDTYRIVDGILIISHVEGELASCLLHLVHLLVYLPRLLDELLRRRVILTLCLREIVDIHLVKAVLRRKGIV